VDAGEVDVIAGYTSDGRIAQHKLIVLDDPRQAIPPYDAIVLVAPRRANDRAMLDALRPLIGAIDVTLMREANLRASAFDATPGRVARWLWAEIEKRGSQKK
jgi:glycine betaine/choline ABC-type transport system substrate-binding protein